MNEIPEINSVEIDRDDWHSPLVSIIVTHYNYSDFLSDALSSILDQSYSNWDCVVVDDGSTRQHRDRAQWITERIDDRRVRFVALDENVGQIPAFYKGLDNTDGVFVCLLDPDDRFARTFLEETIKIHLNNTVACPIVSTDQFTLTKHGVTTCVQNRFKLDKLYRMKAHNELVELEDFVVWVPPENQEWLWTSTSSLVFRRSALNFVRPKKCLAYRHCADAYLATGAHLLGGTLCYTRPLVYRSLHAENAYITQDICSSTQNRQKKGGIDHMSECREDVFEALLANHAPGISPDYLYKVFNKLGGPPADQRVKWSSKIAKKYALSWKKRKREMRRRLGLQVHPFKL